MRVGSVESKIASIVPWLLEDSSCSNDVLRDDHRGDCVAGLDLLERRFRVLDVVAVDVLIERPGQLVEVELLAADADVALALGNLVDDRDARLGRRATDREAHEHGDQRRVEHQQDDDCRRALEQPQVFAEQIAEALHEPSPVTDA